jgi:hypothetical protein
VDAVEPQHGGAPSCGDRSSLVKDILYICIIVFRLPMHLCILTLVVYISLAIPDVK